MSEEIALREIYGICSRTRWENMRKYIRDKGVREDNWTETPEFLVASPICSIPKICVALHASEGKADWSATLTSS